MYCNLFLAFSLIGMDSLEGVKLWADIKFLVYMAAASAFSLGGQIESLTTTWQELPSNEVEKSFLHYICIFNRTVSSHHHKGHSQKYCMFHSTAIFLLFVASVTKAYQNVPYFHEMLLSPSHLVVLKWNSGKLKGQCNIIKLKVQLWYVHKLMFNYMRASREKSAFSCLISGPFSNSNNVVLASLLLQLSNFFFACSTRSNCKFMVEKLFLFEMFYCFWWNGSNPLLFCSYLLPSSSTTTLRDYLKGECIS